jgi:hypothetical protein
MMLLYPAPPPIGPAPVYPPAPYVPSEDTIEDKLMILSGAGEVVEADDELEVPATRILWDAVGPNHWCPSHTIWYWGE